MSNLRRLGAEAEDRAADYLLGLGYTLVTRRFTVREGELDLVAMDGETLVFVEVKHRRGKAHPEEAMNPLKAGRLLAAAERYLEKSGLSDRPFRFDLIAIENEQLRHHVDVSR
ncbi:MAG TPA: YraN family protein [Fimbriimonadaceae bacterium]|nr:YraN family protein [Fimbriimonadaceae bacterium]